ncbi:hypothetical protein B0E53_01054 [Micromonospora sp. MH33]|nr:hypothetical protein B0E53_01054 [Micromonospora sp. MH33]
MTRLEVAGRNNCQPAAARWALTERGDNTGGHTTLCSTCSSNANVMNFYLRVGSVW